MRRENCSATDTASTWIISGGEGAGYTKQRTSFDPLHGSADSMGAIVVGKYTVLCRLHADATTVHSDVDKR